MNAKQQMTTEEKRQQRLAAVDREIERLAEKRKAIARAPGSAEERRRIARQNMIAGAWLRENKPSVFRDMISKLKRKPDIDAFADLASEQVSEPDQTTLTESDVQAEPPESASI